MSRFTFGAAVTLLFLASCVGPAKINRSVEVRDFVGIEEFGENGQRVSLDVRYDLRKNLRLKDGEMTIRNGKRTFAKIKADDVTVLKRSSGVVALPLYVTMNSLAAASAIFSKPRIEDMTVSGTVKLRYGGIGKKLKLKDVPLKEVLDTLGIEEETFLNLFQ